MVSPLALDEGSKELVGQKSQVFGEEAEEQADKEDFEGVAVVAYSLELVVQLAEALGSGDIDRVLLAEKPGFISGNEAEQPDILVQVFELELMLLAVFEVVQAETGEV